MEAKFKVGDKVRFITKRLDELPVYKQDVYWKHTVRGKTGVVSGIVNDNNYRVKYNDGFLSSHDGQDRHDDIFTYLELELID